MLVLVGEHAIDKVLSICFEFVGFLMEIVRLMRLFICVRVRVIYCQTVFLMVL